ncbi:uncharacterized protein LOC131482980 isoform X2 [Ochotona princeps]|uniref:uncharacterized protein LOC131482980 isoform X2 n=1 Tax=Ochotona princeps TaxID=9978 RepID=UPI002714E855|nr:uncharacterized protein LOC131482980 isoform X2 [Ochotona princeps]
MDAGMVKRIVFQLVPAQQRGDPFFVPAFLQTYHRFATTHQVLDLLFQRYHNFQEGRKQDQSCKEALCSLLETWLQRYPGHFYEANDLSCLRKLATYAWTQMPYSDLEFQALELLTQLINEEEYKELVAELESKAEPEAAPQPEPQEPSLPQAVQPPAIKVLQPPKGPTTDPDCEPNKAQEHPGHVLCAPNWSTASQLGILEAGTVQKHMNLLLPAQQAGDILQRFTGTHRVLCLLFPRALCCLVGTSLDCYLVHIHQPQHQASQNQQLMMYRQPRMPLSYLALRVYLLLSQLQDKKPKEAEPEPQGLTNDSVPTPAAALQPQAPKPALEPPECPGAKTQAEPPRGKTTRWPWSRLRLRQRNHSQGRPQHRLPGWVRTLGTCFCIQPSGQSQG